MHSKIAEFLSHPNWGIVGVSENQDRYGSKVYLKLKNAGYNVYAVDARLKQIDEDACYFSLKDLPVVPDVVSIMIPNVALLEVIDECAKLGIKRIWFQPGPESAEAIRRVQDLQIDIIYSECILEQIDSYSTK